MPSENSATYQAVTALSNAQRCRATAKPNAHCKGFTLIELMITVAVIGILAAIAWPNYASYVRRSHRNEAQTVMMGMAAKQQQLLLDTRAYAGSLTDLSYPIPGTVTPYYMVTLDALPSPAPMEPTFTLRATPIGGQLADTCSVLTLSATGAKTPSTCW